MARGRKKENLTPEERLQAALVPESEQPYEVPKNWCWVRLGEFSTSQYGYTAKAIKNDAYPKMLRITDIQECGVNWSDVPNCEITQDNLEKYRLSDGDIVIARTGATTGKSFFLNDPCNSVFASYLIRLRVNKGAFPKYVFDFLQTDHYWKQISELSSGIAQPGVNATKLQSLCFPLSPLAEQQRIVDRIESLFAKLDEAKQKAQDALDSFETRKAAILHKAFTGELTAQWRKEHGVGMESWDNTTLSKIVIGFKYGTSEKSDYSYKGMPVFRIPNITDDGLSFEDLKFLSHKDISDENQIHENDILIVRSNGSRELVGKSVLVPQLDREYAYASFLIRIQPLESVVPNYLVMYLNSTDARMQMFKKAKSSAGINNINSKELGAILINLPSFSEQAEIVCILDNLLAKEQLAKEAAEGVLEQIDLIKKSILARAFRGELGTNDPGEESAVELLKQVL